MSNQPYTINPNVNLPIQDFEEVYKMPKRPSANVTTSLSQIVPSAIVTTPLSQIPDVFGSIRSRR